MEKTLSSIPVGVEFYVFYFFFILDFFVSKIWSCNLFWLGALVLVVFKFVNTIKDLLYQTKYYAMNYDEISLKIVGVCDLSIIFLFAFEAFREILV